MIGLLTGAVIGAGIGMLLAPEGRLGDCEAPSASRPATLVTRRRTSTARASDHAGEWAGKGREFVERAREAVARGAEEVRGYAGAGTGTGTTAPGRAPARASARSAQARAAAISVVRSLARVPEAPKASGPRRL